MTVSYKTTRGQFSKKEEAEVLDQRPADEGITIIRYNLHNLTTNQLSLALHFTAKWIIISEVKFQSRQADDNMINQMTVNEEPEENVFQNADKIVKESKVLNENIDSSEYEDKETEEPNSVVPITGGGSSQMYVGITIGILSMSVLLLIFTIFFILRKNKHRIFSKHSSESFFLFQCSNKSRQTSTINLSSH